MGDSTIPVERSIAQTEATMAALRQPALDALLSEGRASTFTSTAHRDGDVLTIETSGKGTPKQVLKVTSDIHSETTMFNPMDPSTIKMPNPGAFLVGNFTIKDGQNKLIETDKVNFFASHVDDWYSRPDKATLALTRTDASGKSIQTYEPAVSQETGGVNDNGQAIRLATSTNGGPNCGSENIANQGNHRRECDYIIHDAKLGDLSYNETESTEGRTYYRSVVRDMQGKVLGIVEQSFNLDANGDLVSATTSARKPVLPKH